MIKSFKTCLLFILLAVVFVALVMLNNSLLNKARFDLTENQIYSLSPGSKKIVEQLDEPVNLYFFFSDRASVGMTSLRNYANRVYSLLEEYANASDGKLRLKRIDPEPFSEAEDQANGFGLTAASVGVAGDAIYFGLAGRNDVDDEQIIAFFDPSQEQLLEYQISKLIYQLAVSQEVNATVITDLPVNGGQDPLSGRYQTRWAIFDQLEQLYEVEVLDSSAVSIPEQTDVLVLVHPQNYSEVLNLAVDQYVMAGGKALIFVDPLAESDTMGVMAGSSVSNLDALLSVWGIEFNPGQVLLDAKNGLEIRTQTGVERHLGYVGVDAQGISENDVVTSGLEVINGASFGALSKAKNAKFHFSPLLQSSQYADLVDSGSYMASQQLDEIARLHAGNHHQYVLAARISGVLNSAYETIPEGVDWPHPLRAKNAAANLIVVADTDLLTDRFWGSQSQFFGQTLFTPFANNGDFVINAVENLAGSDALISVRSRGTYARPFEVVDELAVEAEQAFRDTEQSLQQQLRETEQALNELQAQWDASGNVLLTAEQQQTIDAYLQQKIEIRKALREVRHQLDKDIEQLGITLKVVNIVVAPLVLGMLLWLIMSLVRPRAKGGQV